MAFDVEMLRTIRHRMVILGMVLLQCVSGYAESSSGTDFWLTFLQHWQSDTPPEERYVSLFFSSFADADVTIEGMTESPATIHVPANSSATFSIRGSQNGAPFKYSYSEFGNNYTSTGVHVTSTAPVFVYAGSHGNTSSGVTNILPTNMLGTSYRLQGIERANVPVEKNSAFPVFCVVGTESEDAEKTHVRLSFPSELYCNNTNKYHNYFFEFDVAPYEVYLFRTGVLSVSNIQIEADNPVAVFQGNGLTCLPADAGEPDHVFEQAYPIHQWGDEFVVELPAELSYGQVGITLAYPSAGSSIQIHPADGKDTTLVGWGTYFYNLDRAKGRTGAYIKTSSRAACYLYTGGSSVNNGIGDPAQVEILPLNHLSNKVITWIPEWKDNAPYTANAIVTTAVGNEGDVKIDGTPLNRYSLLGTHHHYAVYEAPLATGRAHTIRSNDKENMEFSAYVVGYGQQSEAYAFTLCAESTSKKKTAASICAGGTYEFRGKTYSSGGTYYDTVVSERNDTTIYTLELTVHPKHNTTDTLYFCDTVSLPVVDPDVDTILIYRDTMYVKSLTNRYGCDSTVTTYVKIGNTYRNKQSVSLCAAELPWQTSLLDADGVHTLELLPFALDEEPVDTTLSLTLHTADCHCDSVVEWAVHVLPTAIEEKHVKWCTSDGPYYYGNGKQATETGLYKDTLAGKNSYGCDSMLYIYLDVLPTTTTPYIRSVCANDLPYSFPDTRCTHLQDITQGGHYEDTLTTADGCDSIILLDLTIEPVYDTLVQIAFTKGNTIEWGGETVSRDTTIIRHLFSQAHCDSIVTARFVMADVGFIIQDTLCGDNPVLPMGIEYTKDVFDSIQIRFSGGFNDTTIHLSNSGVENISIPNQAHAGRYMIESIVYAYGTAIPYRFQGQVDVLYPSSVLAQKWNDFVGVQTHDYNGGYDFCAFQWYKNDAELPGETGSYLSQPLEIGARYAALLTETDGQQHMTCPLIAVVKEDLYAYPIQADGRQYIRIYVNEPVLMQIYTTTGERVETKHLIGATDYPLDLSAGVYVVRLETINTHQANTIKLVY